MRASSSEQPRTLATAGSEKPSAPVRVLFERMRAGDRQAAADFMGRYGDRIRRRVSGKMNTRMRRLFDSQEIMSTVGRRLDRLVRLRIVSAQNETEFWGFVFELAHRAVIDKARLFARLQRVESEDSEFALLLKRKLSHPRQSDREVEEKIAEAIHLIRNPIDRQVLHLWMQGESHMQIAELMGMSYVNVRRRWDDIRRFLAEALSRDSLDSSHHG